jgi:hypothetical protein
MMIEQRIKQDFQGKEELYAEYLVRSIGTRWRGEVSRWLDCHEVELPLMTTSNVITSNSAMMGTLVNGQVNLNDLVCPDSKITLTQYGLRRIIKSTV